MGSDSDIQLGIARPSPPKVHPNRAQGVSKRTVQANRVLNLGRVLLAGIVL